MSPSLKDARERLAARNRAAVAEFNEHPRRAHLAVVRVWPDFFTLAQIIQ